MAGRYYAEKKRSLIDAQTRLASACTPVWVPISECQGTCQDAWQTYTQLNCPVPPADLYKSISCAGSIPCTCDISSIQQYISGAVTCGDCHATPEGGSCYFFCPDPTQTLSGTNSIKCIKSSENGGWAIPTPANGGQFPTCSQPIPTCPPISGTGGLNAYFGQTAFGYSTCVGAGPGDVCYATCWPNYYSQNGTYKATCTNNGGTLSWDVELSCVCQGDCNTGESYPCSLPQGVNTNAYQYQTNTVFQA